jgi:hypothetical protein
MFLGTVAQIAVSKGMQIAGDALQAKLQNKALEYGSKSLVKALTFLTRTVGWTGAAGAAGAGAAGAGATALTMAGTFAALAASGYAGWQIGRMVGEWGLDSFIQRVADGFRSDSPYLATLNSISDKLKVVASEGATPEQRASNFNFAKGHINALLKQSDLSAAERSSAEALKSKVEQVEQSLKDSVRAVIEKNKAEKAARPAPGTTETSAPRGPMSAIAKAYSAVYDKIEQIQALAESKATGPEKEEQVNQALQKHQKDTSKFERYYSLVMSGKVTGEHEASYSDFLESLIEKISELHQELQAI